DGAANFLKGRVLEIVDVQVAEVTAVADARPVDAHGEHFLTLDLARLRHHTARREELQLDKGPRVASQPLHDRIGRQRVEQLSVDAEDTITLDQASQGRGALAVDAGDLILLVDDGQLDAYADVLRLARRLRLRVAARGEVEGVFVQRVASPAGTLQGNEAR